MNGPRTSVNELAKACSRSTDASEWEELVRRCVPLASLVALRVARSWESNPSPATVDDIVQEVFVKVCEQERRVLREFEPRGEDSFFGLLRIVAVSVANDHFLRLHSAKRGGNQVTTLLIDDGPTSGAGNGNGGADAHWPVLLEQLDRKLRSAPAVIGQRDRALFWLYFRQGFTAEEIARLPAAGLTAKGVESALRRVTLWLRAEVGAQMLGRRTGSG